jgi:hypothetical protein
VARLGGIRKTLDQEPPMDDREDAPKEPPYNEWDGSEESEGSAGGETPEGELEETDLDRSERHD